ncbi:hypothetical protein NDU88_000421 [Pleurodeles waltl]|uniref:Uncharacterized protein n=1 Tax=Pleurodeles waltl TaxID=8319 RepID=A0AAV7VXC4_PLEWA|nr:hypothetical protein NDU88_000421 [Pleurodeles waltl]
MNTDDYRKECLRLLGDETYYALIPRDPTPKLQTQIRKNISYVPKIEMAKNECRSEKAHLSRKVSPYVSEKRTKNLHVVLFIRCRSGPAAHIQCPQAVPGSYKYLPPRQTPNM